MPVQEREAKRNFIAILSEEAEDQRVAEALTTIDRPMTRTFFGLMAAVLNRGTNARWSAGTDTAE